MARTIRLIALFGLSGLVNTAAGFAVVILLDIGLGVAPALANATGYLVGVALGFVLNRRFVFGAEGDWRSHGLRYGLAAATAFALNQAVLAGLGRALGAGHLERLAAQVAAMAVYSAVLFVLCRTWVFVPQRSGTHEAEARGAASAPADLTPPDEAVAEWRGRLNQETGGEYLRVVRSLKPDYARAWRDIALGYAGLVAVLALASLRLAWPWTIPQLLLAAIATGYGLAFLQLFLHEAAHGNLSGDRRTNDRLTNIFIAWHLGADAARYRATHLVHHRRHGQTDDSEQTYFNALTPAFLVACLTGLQALRVFRVRAADSGGSARGDPWPVVRGALAHLALLAVLLALGDWRAPLAWVAGVGVFLPFFGALRQLLEHRSPAADPTVDYRRHPQGAYTRMFRGGILAATFGGAGFDRHLLHHWEPQVPYARLPDLDAYVRTTSAAALLDERTTTYFAALREIWRRDARRTHAL